MKNQSKLKKAAGDAFKTYYAKSALRYGGDIINMRFAMELIELKNRISDTIQGLPLQKLKIALDFLEDLQRSDEEETQSLLEEAGFIEDYRQAKEDIRTGKTTG